MEKHLVKLLMVPDNLNVYAENPKFQNLPMNLIQT